MEERTVALVTEKEHHMKQLPQTVVAAQAAVATAEDVLSGVQSAVMRVVREAEKYLIAALRDAGIPTIEVEVADYNFEVPREGTHFLVTEKEIPGGASILAIGWDVDLLVGDSRVRLEEWDPDAELIPATPTYFREINED